MKILLVYLNKDKNYERCLDSLKKYSPEIEVVAVQADPTKTKIAEELYNEWVDKLDDDVMIWHTDMLATENWYQDVKKYWNQFDIIGCKLIYPDGIVQHYGGVILADGRGYHPHQHCLNIGLNEPMETAYVTGPSMIIKKEVFKKIKWDTSFPAYPDVDFCFQARENGFKVGVIPVTLIHEEALERNREKEAENLIEGKEKFIAKWMNTLMKYRN